MSIEKWKILQVAGRLLKYAQLAALSDKFGYGYVSPPPEDPEQGDEPTQQRVRFLQWFGFRSRPVVNGGEAIVAAPRGGTTNAVALAADHLGYGPTDLKEGESAVYDKSGSVIHLFEDGSLSVTAKGGAVVTLDKDGNATVVPKSGAQVRLGDAVLASLDNVVLFTALKNYIDTHAHGPGGYVAPMGGGPVTGSSGAPVSGLGTNAQSPNVLAKKP